MSRYHNTTLPGQRRDGLFYYAASSTLAASSIGRLDDFWPAAYFAAASHAAASRLEGRALAATARPRAIAVYFIMQPTC